MVWYTIFQDMYYSVSFCFSFFSTLTKQTHKKPEGLLRTYSKRYSQAPNKPENKYKHCINSQYCSDVSTAIITHPGFENALDYKPRILGSKIEEFPCLVHKLSVILTALQYKPQ